MAESKLNETFQQVKQLIIEMPLMKKMSIVLTIGISFGVLFFLVQLSTKSNYQILFSGLKGEDVSHVASALDKFHVPYQVDSSTQSILVPGEKVLEARLKLAHEGLPQFGGIGFELFDQKSFGMTDFEQRLNYQRALQGELVRTINELREVEDSRVHLVIPQSTVFGKEKEKATASIIIKFAAGERISEATVEAIAHLVSASVPGMDPKNVTVVDSSGALLSSGSDGAVGSGQAAYKKKRDVEAGYEGKIRALIEPIVGMGKVQVQVTANLDFTSKEITEEKFDPESVAVRSETRSKSKESENQADNQNGKNKDAGTESISYEISKQIQNISKPLGEMKSLSVAVLVDGIYEKDPAKPEEKPVYKARTDDEIKNYESIIKSAIGFDEKRGDQLKVMNLAFQTPESLFAESPGAGLTDMGKYAFYFNILINVIVVLISVMIIFFVIRPLIQGWTLRRNAAAEALALAAGAQQSLPPGMMKGELQKQAQEDPNSMVSVLRHWIE